MNGNRIKIDIRWEASLFEIDYNCGAPIARLNNCVFSELGTHSGTWLKIHSKGSGETIYRIGRGCGRDIKGLRKDVIMVDYYGAMQLGAMDLVKEGENREKGPTDIVRKSDGVGVEKQNTYKADWEVAKANLIDCIIANCKHPDRGYRVSMQIAFIGLAIGLSSLGVSLISLFA